MQRLPLSINWEWKMPEPCVSYLQYMINISHTLDDFFTGSRILLLLFRIDDNVDSVCRICLWHFSLFSSFLITSLFMQCLAFCHIFCPIWKNFSFFHLKFLKRSLPLIYEWIVLEFPYICKKIVKIFLSLCTVRRADFK